ncbi:hypothetical protein G6F59_015051 [Rhizopus arrhizus]|nr:hypothetical protein G6F59_015051 [Rhizopus arrhizus]
MWLADAGVQVEAAGDTVAIHFDIGVADGCSAGRDLRDRQHFLGHAGTRGGRGQYRQHHPAIAADGRRQRIVLAAVAPIRFGQHQVQGDALGTSIGQTVQQARVYRARPGPLADALPAAFVDGHDQHAGVGAVIPATDQCVVGALVLPPQPLALAGQHGQHTGQQGQCDPFAPRQWRTPHNSNQSSTAPPPAP